MEKSNDYLLSWYTLLGFSLFVALLVLIHCHLKRKNTAQIQENLVRDEIDRNKDKRARKEAIVELLRDKNEDYLNHYKRVSPFHTPRTTPCHSPNLSTSDEERNSPNFSFGHVNRPMTKEPSTRDALIRHYAATNGRSGREGRAKKPSYTPSNKFRFEDIEELPVSQSKRESSVAQPQVRDDAVILCDHTAINVEEEQTPPARRRSSTFTSYKKKFESFDMGFELNEEDEDLTTDTSGMDSSMDCSSL